MKVEITVSGAGVLRTKIEPKRLPIVMQVAVNRSKTKVRLQRPNFRRTHIHNTPLGPTKTVTDKERY